MGVFGDSNNALGPSDCRRSDNSGEAPTAEMTDEKRSLPYVAEHEMNVLRERARLGETAAEAQAAEVERLRKELQKIK